MNPALDVMRSNFSLWPSRRQEYSGSAAAVASPAQQSASAPLQLETPSPLACEYALDGGGGDVTSVVVVVER